MVHSLLVNCLLYLVYVHVRVIYMLICTDCIRDALCNEVVQALQKVDLSSDSEGLKHHLFNITNILMSDNDFVHVNADVWSRDLPKLAEMIGPLAQAFANYRKV